jgi:hypothetical protein
MADRIILRVIFFFKVLFFEHVKNCKLHKTSPGSFFAQINHLIKAEAAKFKEHLLIRHKQISHSAEHTRSLSLNYRPTQGPN